MKKKGSVVQLDRISDFGSEGWGFESSLSHLLLFFFFITKLDAQTIVSEKTVCASRFVMIKKIRKKWPREDSNLQPSEPKSDILSS